MADTNQRRNFIKTGAALGVGSLLATNCSSAQKPPNFLILVTDDQR